MTLGKLLALLTLVTLRHGAAQSQPEQLIPILKMPLQTADVAADQMSRYLLHRAPELPRIATAAQWTEESRRLRKRLLEVVFYGWPKEWINAPPRFEDLGIVASGPGYRMRKLRYEIVPGFQSAAVLYEPENLTGKVPAILDVNGHVGAEGKAIEYKQKRCINQARQGMLALNLEFLGYGELGGRENEHHFGAQLDLVGVNGVGIFYLAARKGLDYLCEHPHVDRSRVGMTGLSGGGWQTILLSALDERVSVAVPVAGYSGLQSRLARPKDIGDFEQNPTDFLTIQDYPALTAMRAPRPTLLIYNAEDDCCFRAPLVKPDIFDAVIPFFRLYGPAAEFAWHENTDPSTHNYQRDNRIQSYQFFSRHLGLPAVVRDEIPVDREIKRPEELRVGLSPDNLTILKLARQLAREIRREDHSRAELKQVVRYRPLSVMRSWGVANTKNKGVETRSQRFQFSDDLSATGVWLKAITTPADAPIAVVLNDNGKQESAAETSDCINRGEQVLALDLLFMGDAAPGWRYAQLVAAIGERPLGIEVAQLIAATRWLQNTSGARQARLISTGIRSQVISLVAAALEPALVREVLVHAGMPSLQYLLDVPVTYEKAPDLFCLDLYKKFDLNRLNQIRKESP
jgi:dienelactone hydrolase